MHPALLRTPITHTRGELRKREGLNEGPVEVELYGVLMD